MSKGDPLSLVGLLFGNLGDALDEETRDQLSSWNPNGVFDFNSIGITEGDDDKAKGSRRLDDGVIQKLADAQDYEDIDEVAEEEPAPPPQAPAHAPNLDSSIAQAYLNRALETKKTTTTTTTATSKLDDDNYDDEEATPTPAPTVVAATPTAATASASATTPESKEVTVAKKKRVRAPVLKDKAVSVIPQALQILFASPDTFDQEDARDPVIKQVCSAVFSPTGPILKFSELFVYLQNYLSPTRHRRIRLSTPTKPTINENTLAMELDEEVVFGLGGLQLEKEEETEADDEEEYSEMDFVLTSPPLNASAQLGSSSSQVVSPSTTTAPAKSFFNQSQELHLQLAGGVPLWEPGQQRIKVPPVFIPEVTYHPVVLDEWEDRIIWDPPAEDSDSQRVPSIAIEFDQVSRNSKTSLWGALLPPLEVPTPSPSTTAPAESVAGNSILGKELDDTGDLLDKSGSISTPYQSSPVSSPPTVSSPTAPPTPFVIPPSLPPQPPQPDRQWSLFPLINKELEDGRWLHDVIWEDTGVHKTPARILDLNDKYMLIEVPGEVPVKPQTPANQAQKQNQSSSDATVPEAPADAEGSKKKKPKPKAKAKANGTEQPKEDEATPLRITPTHYGREVNSGSTRESNLDMFNLSHDDYYSMAHERNRLQHKITKALVVHSMPAAKLSLVPTHLTPSDLQNFHRPRSAFPLQSPFRVAVVMKDSHSHRKPKKSLNRIDIMKHKSDLSGREGRVIFTEYMEERPPLLENVGMGTRISNFYRKKSPDDTPILSYEDGETILLEEQDESPFLGDIEPGHSVQAFVNNLFKAPIHKHDAASTDFLLVKSKEGKKWYIREMGPVYNVGQLMPLMEVPAPNSRAANQFIKLRMQAFVYRAFMKKSNHQRRLRISDVYTAFPRQTDTAIRKRFQDCADFQRGGDDSGWWTLKESFTLPTEEELQKMVSPEAVCCFEAMLRGQQFLSDIGITLFTNVGSIPQALSHLPDNNPTKQRAMIVENELQLTPWNLTYNFISSMQGKGRLQLTGLGDPSGRGEMFSYLRMPQKVIQQKHKQMKQNIPKYQVTGTDADLRKLSLENARLVLLKFGVDEEEIQNMTRWDRIAMVRKKSSEAAMQAGGGGGNEYSMTKFARGSRYSLDHQALMYREQCQSIFDAQLRALSDDSLEELEDFGKDLEQMLGADTEKTKNTKRSQQEEDAEEQAERQALAEFLEEDKKPSQSQTIVRSPPSQVSPLGLSMDLSPGRHEDSGDDSDVSASTLGNDSDTSQSGKPKKIIKHTKVITNDDGTQRTVVEYITDPVLVREYLKRKKRINPLPNKVGVQGADDIDRKQKQREKRRLQEQLRRLQRNAEKQQSLTEKLQNMQDDDVPTTGTQLKCGACGLPGHMRTNRTCPLFQEPLTSSISSPLSPRIKEESPIQDPAQEPLKVEGTKLRFSKKILSPPESSGFVLRIKKDNLTFPPKGSRKRKYDDDDDDSPETPRQSHRSRIRKGGAGAEVELSNIFEKVIKHIKTLTPYATPFLKPVLAKEAPGYYNFIKNPISIADMHEKNLKYLYKTRASFMADVQLMYDNCYTYNATSSSSYLIEYADKLRTAFDDQLREHDADILKYEEALQNATSTPQTPSSPHIHSTPATPYSPHPNTTSQPNTPSQPSFTPLSTEWTEGQDFMHDDENVEIDI